MTYVGSHTGLDSFETCAREFWHKYIAKDLPKEKKSDAQLKGIEVHEVFDVHLRAGVPLPPQYARYQGLMDGVKRAAEGKTLETEKKMGMTSAGAPTEFFGADVWFRGAADAIVHGENVAFIADWKNGKKREDDGELRRHALLLKVAYPAINKVWGAHAWLQTNEMGKPHDLSNFALTYNEIKATMKTIEMLDPSTEWAANPSWKCGWCPVKKCPHNKT